MPKNRSTIILVGGGVAFLLLVFGASIKSATAQSPQVTSKVGTPSGYAVTVQTNPAAPLAITGSISTSGAADTVGANSTFNANSVCAQVAIAGQTGAGFFLGAGSPVATFTPSVSKDNTNWTVTSFVDVSGNTSATIVNPVGYQDPGLVIRAGDRFARVCTTAYTSGSAVGFMIATTAAARPPASGADVTDRAGRLLGVVYGSRGQQLVQTATNFNLQVESAVGGTLIDPRAIRALTSSDVVSAAQSGNWDIRSITGTVPLPAGAATSAKQPALGTAASPSTDVITTITPDVPGTNTTLSAACATGVSCGANTTATINLAGQQTATMVITASTSPVGITAVADCSKDGSNWILSGTPSTAGLVGLQLNGVVTYVINNPVALAAYTLVPPPECKGATILRLRNATLTSGSIAAQGRAVAGALGDVSYIGGRIFQQGQQTAANSLSFITSSEQPALPLSTIAAASTTQNTITLTTTTETTIIAALGSGLFSDLTFLSCFNATSTATEVDVRDATGGTVRWPGYLSATAGAGFVVPFNPSSPWRSQASNANWTVKLSAAVGGSGVLCSAQAIQR